MVRRRDRRRLLGEGAHRRGVARDAAGLQQVLLKNKPQIIRNLCERMLTYALGRGVEHADECTVNAIAQSVAKDRYRFWSLVTAIVQSDAYGVYLKQNSR